MSKFETQSSTIKYFYTHAGTVEIKGYPEGVAGYACSISVCICVFKFCGRIAVSVETSEIDNLSCV